MRPRRDQRALGSRSLELEVQRLQRAGESPLRDERAARLEEWKQARELLAARRADVHGSRVLLVPHLGIGGDRDAGDMPGDAHIEQHVVVG